MSDVTLSHEECDGTLVVDFPAIPELPPRGTVESASKGPGTGHA
jgi:hypothetical protein